MTRQTKAENLKDLIVNLGQKPKGDTTAELLNQLETLLSGGGGGGSVDEARVRAIAAEVVQEAASGDLSDSDYDDIFGD